MNVLGGSFIDLEVFGYSGYSECKIFSLFHKDTLGEGDFAPGQEDVFSDSDLQACDDKRVHYYPGGPSWVRITHHGDDGWRVMKIWIVLYNRENHDSSIIGCGEREGDGGNVFISGGESVDLLC